MLLRSPRSAASSLAKLVLFATLAGACRKDSASQSTPRNSVQIATNPLRAPELRAASLTQGADVAALIREEEARTRQDGRQLIVYIGAAWCEPCHAWHDALAAGTAGPLPAVRFLEFDLDKDGEALAQAGYHTHMVPFFARPSLDGRATSVQFAGVRKGGDYVAEIRERVAEMLSVGL